jgi:hypothetical protein
MASGDTRDMNREHERALRVLQTLAAELRLQERAARQRIDRHRRSVEHVLPPLKSAPGG